MCVIMQGHEFKLAHSMEDECMAVCQDQWLLFDKWLPGCKTLQRLKNWPISFKMRPANATAAFQDSSI